MRRILKPENCERFGREAGCSFPLWASFLLLWVSFPTDPFTIFEPEHQDISKNYVVRERHTTEFEAQKLEKGRSGSLGAFRSCMSVC